MSTYGIPKETTTEKTNENNTLEMITVRISDNSKHYC